MAGNVQEKQLRWYNIALMSFITVWGFGNVVNNYANQGLVVVFSWVFIFALYFTPYALIVGQLGSTFKDGKGGVSTWIKHTMGPGLANPAILMICLIINVLFFVIPAANLSTGNLQRSWKLLSQEISFWMMLMLNWRPF